MINALTLANIGRASEPTRPALQSVATAPSNDFGAMLARFASETVDTMRQGEAAAAAGLHGTLPVHEVVDKVMAAEQALHTGIALRDKIVAAYLEISRMTI